jgi:hypothetical protein
MPSAKRTASLTAILSAAVVVICMAGEPSDKTPPTDTSAEAEAIAKAFITALVNSNIQEAASFVIPEERAEFTKELKKGIPPFPAEPKIKVRVKDDGIQADVFILNTQKPKSGPPPGLDMKLVNGKWWIVK